MGSNPARDANRLITAHADATNAVTTPLPFKALTIHVPHPLLQMGVPGAVATTRPRNGRTKRHPFSTHTHEPEERVGTSQPAKTGYFMADTTGSWNLPTVSAWAST